MRFGSLFLPAVAVLAMVANEGTAHAKKRAQDASATSQAAPPAPTAQSLYLRSLEERGAGKTSTAKRTLSEALGIAMHDRSAQARATEKKIRAELQNLEPMLSRVNIAAATENADNVRVEIDGDKDRCRKLPCSIVMDQGVKTIVASEPGKKSWEATLSIASGTIDVRLPALGPEEPPPPAEPSAQDEDKITIPQEKVQTSFTLGMSPAAIFRTGAYQGGTTAVTILHLEYNRFSFLKPFVNLGFVYNSPVQGVGAVAMSNPAVGITSSFTIAKKFQLSVVALGAMPIGSGQPTAAVAGAARESTSIAGRMFDLEYTTLGGGIDFGYMPSQFGITSRTRVTHSIRTRGEGPDPSKGALNTTIEFAYSPTGIGLANGDLTIYIDPRLSVWLTTPNVVVKDASAREQFMFGGGARWSARMGKASRFSSMLGFYHAVDAPLSRTAYNQLEADIAVSW